MPKDSTVGNLLLGRYPGERILIISSDGDIWVTFEGMDRGQARLRFNAAKSVDILREELLDRSDGDE
jgi:sRNA-binding carbon storage regulator CsrA